jgi:subfamily B ATP-binding cassette protein MsbA
MIHLQHYRRLFGKPAFHWKLLLQALSAMLIMAATMALLPILVQHIVDGAFIRQDPSLIQTTSLAIIALFIIRGAAGYTSLYTAGKAGGKLGMDLRRDFFNKLLTLPVNCYAHLNHHQIGALIAHINAVTRTVTRHAALLAQDGLTIIGLMICALYLNQEFSILLLLATPFIVLIKQMTGSHCNKPGQKNLLAVENLIQHLSQSVEHYRKIRLDGGQTHESQRLDKISGTILEAEMQQSRVTAMARPLGQVITALILTAVTYVIALQVINGALGLPETSALITIALLLILPVQRIANLPGQLEHDRKTLAIIFAFLDQAPEQDTGTLSMPRSCGKLVFDHVRFGRDAQTKPVLSHIHLSIRPGEVIVFTGYTGEEKNALIDLILRLQQPSSGEIWLDDHALPDIRLNHLYANIALIPADTFLLDERIAGNIAYGAMRCANEARITEAAQASRAMEFIRQMPEGLQTRIGQEDTEISKKQLQQLAIARAFVKDTPVLIVDEIPAAHESDPANLLSALEELMQNRTTLIFNQHIPRLKKIDRIVVLKNGCITENLKASDTDTKQN